MFTARKYTNFIKLWETGKPEMCSAFWTVCSTRSPWCMSFHASVLSANCMEVFSIQALPKKKKLVILSVAYFVPTILNYRLQICPGFGWDRADFSLVARTALCFGFSMRRMLIIHWCFQLLLRNQGLFNFPGFATVQEHEKLGGSIARTSDQN